MSDLAARLATLSPDQRASVLSALRDKRSAAGRDTRPAGGQDGPSSTAGDEVDYDVVVIGGGLAGLSLALQLVQERSDARVLVVERDEHPVPEVVHKVGESSVEIGARYLRDVLGLHDHLKSEQLNKFGLRIFFGSNGNEDIAGRMELGATVTAPITTYQLDRGRLENALADEARAAGVELLGTTAVRAVTLIEQGPHRVQVQTVGQDERDITARWVVDASGRRRLLARQQDLTRKVDHEANAVWFRVGASIDVKTWSEDPLWHGRIAEGDRALSTNHLMGHGYWVWIIPLASGATSIGIVTDPAIHDFAGMHSLDQALAWLREHEPQLAASLCGHRQQILDFRLMRDYAYTSDQLFSGAQRWCLTGEAGLFLDPLYSPGIDLIAIGNGLIVDLIDRDLSGEDVRDRAAVHDTVLLEVSRMWLGLYEGQYQLMGSPRIMSAKVIWDTAFYWGVFGLLYFHDEFSSLAQRPELAGKLARLAALSSRVQAFFREWRQVDDGEQELGFVDLYSSQDFMVQLYRAMDSELDAAQVAEQLDRHIGLFEQLAGQLMSTVMTWHAQRPDPAAYEWIQRWQVDPLINELVGAFRRRQRTQPTSSDWLAVGHRALEASR